MGKHSDSLKQAKTENDGNSKREWQAMPTVPFEVMGGCF